MKSVAQRVAPGSWGAHRSIGAAVRDARPGDVITVQAGTYTESLVLAKDVVLVAKGTVRLVAPRGPAVTVHAGRVELRGFALVSPAPREAAVLLRGGEPVLRDCEITGGRIEVAAAAAPLLSGCSVRQAEGAAVRLTGTSRTTLEALTVGGCTGDGVVVDDEASLQLTEALVDGVTGRGVVVTAGAHAALTRCEIRGSGAGRRPRGRTGLRGAARMPSARGGRARRLGTRHGGPLSGNEGHPVVGRPPRRGPKPRGSRLLGRCRGPLRRIGPGGTAARLRDLPYRALRCPGGGGERGRADRLPRAPHHRGRGTGHGRGRRGTGLGPGRGLRGHRTGRQRDRAGHRARLHLRSRGRQRALRDGRVHGHPDRVHRAGDRLHGRTSGRLGACERTGLRDRRHSRIRCACHRTGRTRGGALRGDRRRVDGAVRGGRRRGLARLPCGGRPRGRTPAHHPPATAGEVRRHFSRRHRCPGLPGYGRSAGERDDHRQYHGPAPGGGEHCLREGRDGA